MTNNFQRLLMFLNWSRGQVPTKASAPRIRGVSWKKALSNRIYSQSSYYFHIPKQDRRGLDVSQIQELREQRFNEYLRGNT